MGSLLTTGLNVVFGVIAIILAATAIASTNSGVVGSLAWTVMGFIAALLAVKVLQSLGSR